MPFNTVLLVDGDRRSARLLARMLGEDGVEVEVVFDGAAAVARLADGPAPAAVVTELHLPGCDGLAVASRALHSRENASVVLLTGYPQLVPDALRRRVTVHTKPVDYSRLRGELRRAVERYRAGGTQGLRQIDAERAG